MILKYIQKQLKLRTIRILREKHLMEFSCVAVKQIPLAMFNWYVEQVEDFARYHFIHSKVPFRAMTYITGNQIWEERLIFLNWLEQEVMAGRK